MLPSKRFYKDAVQGDNVIGSVSIQLLTILANTPEDVISMPLTLSAGSCVAAVETGDLLLEFKACFIPVAHFSSYGNKLYRIEVSSIL